MKYTIYQLIYFFLFYINILNSSQLKFESSHIISLTNQYFLLINEKGVFTYDYSFSKIVNQYYFDIVNININKNNNLIISQISNNNEEYILCVNNKKFFIFNEFGKYILSIELTSIFINSDIKLLSSYKMINSYLYFIVGYNNYSSESFIKIIKLNIDSKIILEYKSRKINSLFNSKNTCQIMKSSLYGDVLTCFYLINEYLNVSTFDINDNLKLVLTKDIKYDISSLKTEIKSIISQNKKISIIYFSNNESGNFLYYYIDINKFFIQTKIIKKCNNSKFFNIFNIKSTQEFIGVCFSPNNNISIIKFNNNLEISDIKNEYLNITINEYNRINFFIIQYSFYYQRYLLIINFNLEENKKIQNYIHILPALFNPNKFKNEYYLKKIYKNDLFNKKSLNNNISYIHKENKIKYKKEEIKRMRYLNEKCKENDEISLKNSLCIECNTEKGYYPIVYNNEDIGNNIQYQECHNSTTIPINYYFNSELKVFEQCYESCLKCFGKGDKNDNNCIICNFNYIFKPEAQFTKNCVINYAYYYYYSLTGEYMYTDNYYCPEKISFIIEDKKKCIYDCKMDDIYKFQYNGECLKNCPENTFPNSLNQCLDINTEKCTITIKNTQILGYTLNFNIINQMAKTFAKEFLYTNNHVSQFIAENNLITFYKNKSCLSEFHLNNSIIDFNECLTIINENYYISSPLIAIIDKIGKYNYPFTKYAFFNPFTGEKLDTSICNNSSVKVRKNISSIYKKDEYDWIVNQNIDIYDINSSFYSSTCSPFQSNNSRDVIFKDRILLFYPNISLCEDSCEYNGTNYTTLTTNCICIFNETDYYLMNINLLEDDYLKAEIDTKIITSANFEDSHETLRIHFLVCFKKLITFKYIITNIGGLIVLVLIIIQIIYFVLLVKSNFLIKISEFILLIVNLYIDYKKQKSLNQINKKQKENIKNSITIDNKKESDDGNCNTSHIRRSKLKNENDKKIIINIKNVYDKEKIENNSSSNDMSKKIIETAGLVQNNTNKKDKNKKRNSLIDLKNINYFDKYKNGIFTEKDVNEYLSPSLDNMDFYDVLKKDKRTFGIFLINLIVKKQIIANTFFIEEETIPKYLKIIVFILYIVLYLLTNSFFFGTSNITKIYYIENNMEYVLFFIKRLIKYLVYSFTIIAIIRFLMDKFFVDKESIRKIIKRENDDEKFLRDEIDEFIKSLKIKYKLFIIINFILMVISWYYITCFNNAYPNTKVDWIVLSIIVIVLAQIVSAALAFIEACLRFIALKRKTSWIFTLSQYVDSFV